MDSKIASGKPVGVVGAGSFGTVVANILAEKSDVYLFARKPEVVDLMIKERISSGQHIHKNIHPTSELSLVAEKCDIIFPVVPSAFFRDMMVKLAPYLHPYHILIHGTKGLDLSFEAGKSLEDYPTLNRDQVRTMSEVILEETNVVRVGCLAGPNLAREMAAGQPAATVVASQFEEVITWGQKLLRNERFQVYGNADLIGVELSGILKNIIAIAAGALHGMGLGENARALLISRGLVEMIHLGKAFGGNVDAFLGVAGIGDLVATSTSSLSRNFTVGFRLSQGQALEDILVSMEEIAEGVNTIRITKKLADHYKVRAPITETLHKVLFEGMTVEKALQYLMRYPLNVDIDFL